MKDWLVSNVRHGDGQAMDAIDDVKGSLRHTFGVNYRIAKAGRMHMYATFSDRPQKSPNLASSEYLGQMLDG